MKTSRRSAPTIDQLKHAIDRGAANDKVDWPDPAASPLGTDAEAGGAAPKPSEIANAAAHEIEGKWSADQRHWTGLAVVGFVLVILVSIAVSVLIVANL
jgi:hypothetical protein